MRTILTGGSGYIGLHTLRELLGDGQEVTAVVRSPEKLGLLARHPRLEIVEADLENEARILSTLPGHDICVHAALIWGEAGSELEARDVAVTAKLFDAAGRVGLRRGIYISSAAVHRPFAGEMCEEDGLGATDFYARRRRRGSSFCAQHARGMG